MCIIPLLLVSKGFFSQFTRFKIKITTQKGGAIINIFVFILAYLIFNAVVLLFFKPILLQNPSYLVSSVPVFRFLAHNINLNFLILLFVILTFFDSFVIFHYIYGRFKLFQKKSSSNFKAPILGLLVGKDLSGNKVYVPEKSLYQNFLITGSIGSGKTSSAMYPFTKQLISYKADDFLKKIGFLILDVKGNFYSKVLEFAKENNRLDDVIVIELNGKYKYNPLDKPELKSSIIANRLKTILLLFSPNNTESYWLDKVEQILECAIDFCRIYNDNYVTFDEIHKLVTDFDYFSEKIKALRKDFVSGKLSKQDCYLLYHSITFLKKDYYSLDTRTFSILQSEITRITNVFISDYDIHNTFCPTKSEENFYGFKDVIDNGKIVVLNMNIAEYKNLSKIIAAYLKLDFQTDVLKQLSNSGNSIRTTAFISDEYQEYVTSSDANFFSQSREAKCINIVSVQSYTSIINTLNNPNASKVIIQNLVNKLWYRTDDVFTIEDIQKQIGKEEKKRVSKTISENAKNSTYNPFFKNFSSSNSSLSESVNSYFQNDFVYDYNFFTQELKTFYSVAFLSTGDSVLKPQCLQMIPYFFKE